MSFSPEMEDCITISDDEDVELIEHVVNLEPIVIDLTDSDDSSQNDENSPRQHFSSQTRLNPFDIFSRTHLNDPLKTKSQPDSFATQSHSQTKTSQQHSHSSSIFKSQTPEQKSSQSQPRQHSEPQPQFQFYPRAQPPPQPKQQPQSNPWYSCNQQSQHQSQPQNQDDAYHQQGSQPSGLFDGSQRRDLSSESTKTHSELNNKNFFHPADHETRPPAPEVVQETTKKSEKNQSELNRSPQSNKKETHADQHTSQIQKPPQPTQPQQQPQPWKQPQNQPSAGSLDMNDKNEAPVAQQSETNSAKPQLSDRELMVAQKALGNEKYKNNLFDDAVRVYKRVIELARKLGDKDMAATIHFNLAMTYYRLGSFDQAADECANAVKINDNYIKAHLKRGEIYQRQRKFDEAVICYEHCCELDNTNHDYSTLLNNARLAANRVKKKDYCQILGVPPVFGRDELRKAYRKKALIHHPDRHPDVDIVSRRIHEKYFKDAYEAFSLLDKSYGYR